MKIYCFLLLLVFGGVKAMALQLAGVLQSGMVIQQNQPFTVWGKAKAGASVRIQADWTAEAILVKADRDGNFSGIVAVPAVQAGDYRVHRLLVEGDSSRIELMNLLIGEVWLCSGQSNMQFALKEVVDSTQEVAAADYPNLRLLDVRLNFSAQPIEELNGKWVACSPATAAKFSAVGYYFGRELQQVLRVPVGIIFSGIGASAAQAYVPEPVLAGDTELNRAYLQPYLTSERSKEVIDGGFSFEKVTRPCLLYNAMIHPLRHLSFKGVCWYQGETNRQERGTYTRLMKAMIRSWRDSCSRELPFYYVQVAPYFLEKEDPVLADYAFFREAQERIAVLNNTAMVTTIDVGEVRNLHPHNKKPIGIRLAKTALNRIYGKEAVVYRGPQFQHLEIRGREAVVFFEPGTVAGGLRTDDGLAPGFFTIAGEDGVFYPAEARIAGDQVIVRAAGVKKPVAVRYAFTNYPVTHLQNGEGWPVIPFRTDEWAEPPVQTK